MPIRTPYLRSRVVPFYEIKKTAHPLYGGREIKDSNYFFGFEHREELQKGVSTSEIFQFFKDMHTIRNAVVHGRLDDVLEGRLKIKSNFDINRLRYYVHILAILFVLNENLREAAHRLALGEQVQLKTIYYN